MKPTPSQQRLSSLAIASDNLFAAAEATGGHWLGMKLLFKPVSRKMARAGVPAAVQCLYYGSGLAECQLDVSRSVSRIRRTREFMQFMKVLLSVLSSGPGYYLESTGGDFITC